MLMEVKKHIKLVWLYFKFNLAASMEYRASFLIQVFGMILNNMTFIFFWWVIFGKVGLVADYGMKDVMFIWALTSSCFGFAHILFGNFSNIKNVIINGELDTYLLQPKNVYINVLCSRTVISAWGDLIYGLVLFPIAYGFNPLKILLFLGFTVFGGLLFVSLLATVETLTFFFGNSSALSRLVFEFMISFSLYPEGIFKNSIRWIFYSVLPVGFVIFIPYRIMKAFDPVYLVVLVLVDLLYISFGYMLFRKGLKRYESGNLITTRL
jgi:ABC-type uncharacterized transport system, permease component